MILVGLKDVKTAGFTNVMAVPCVDHYKHILMEKLMDNSITFSEFAHDYEVYSVGEMDGSGRVESNVEFVCQVAEIKREMHENYLAYHIERVRELSKDLGKKINITEV